MLFFQRYFYFLSLVVLVQFFCDLNFHFVQASPGKKIGSINAIMGTPVPEQSNERGSTLSSSSSKSSLKQQQQQHQPVKRLKLDLNKTPSPESEATQTAQSPHLSKGVITEKDLIPVKSSRQDGYTNATQKYYWKLKGMTLSNDPVKVKYATDRLARRKRSNKLSLRRRRAAEKAKFSQNEQAQQDQ